ncbi:MAG: UDP-glucose dehydrogenase family protein [Fidelibacterota bacterium]
MKKITMIGTGYVGLVTGAGISDFGHVVRCVDIDTEKIQMLQSGVIPIHEPGLKRLVQRNVAGGRLTFSTEVEQAIQSSEIIFIAVGTPPADNGEADLTAVKAVATIIGNNLNGFKIICTKSTVPIGTGKLISQIISSHKPPEGDFEYVSNPEFLREGAAVTDFTHPDRVVIGASNDRAFRVMQEIYRPLYINETPMIHTAVETAEMIKYAANAFLALKISYINEVANLCEVVGADVHVVARALGLDGRISPKFLHPGPGFGGSCFPKDTRALVSVGREKGQRLHTIEAAIQANELQKTKMVEKLYVLLGGNFNGKTVAVLGLSFKPETDDVRESSSLHMVQALLKAGARVKAYDPVASTSMERQVPEAEYCSTWQEAVRQTDGCVIMTEWNEFRALNLDELKNLMETPIVLDTRNVLSMAMLEQLGFVYDNVGRKQKKNEA